MITGELPSKISQQNRAFFVAAQSYCNCQINFCIHILKNLRERRTAAL